MSSPVNIIPEEVALMSSNKYVDNRIKILDALLPQEYFEVMNMKLASLSTTNNKTVEQMKRYTSQYVPLEDNPLAEPIVDNVVDGLSKSSDGRVQLIESIVGEIDKTVNLISENVSADIAILNTRLIFIGLILSINLGVILSIEADIANDISGANNVFKMITTLTCVYLSAEIVYLLQVLYGVKTSLLMHNLGDNQSEYDDNLGDNQSEYDDNEDDDNKIHLIRVIHINFKGHSKMLRRSNVQHRIMFPIVLVLSVWQQTNLNSAPTVWVVVVFSLYIVMRGILSYWGNINTEYGNFMVFLFDGELGDYNGKDTKSLEILCDFVQFKTTKLIGVLIDHAFWTKNILYYARYDAYLKRKYKYLRKVELAIQKFDLKSSVMMEWDKLQNIWNTVKNKGVYYVLKFGAKTTPAEIASTFRNIDDALDMKNTAVLDCTRVYLFALKIQTLQLELFHKDKFIEDILEPYFPNVAKYITSEVKGLDKSKRNWLKKKIVDTVYNLNRAYEESEDYILYSDYPDGFSTNKRLKISIMESMALFIGFFLTIVNFFIIVAFDAIVSIILVPFLIPVLTITLIDVLTATSDTERGLSNNSYTDKVSEAATTLLYPKVGSKVHKVTRLLINKASAMKLWVLRNKRNEIHEYMKQRGNWADNDDISETSPLTFKLN
jgi:hypothetical protein